MKGEFVMLVSLLMGEEPEDGLEMAKGQELAGSWLSAESRLRADSVESQFV